MQQELVADDVAVHVAGRHEAVREPHRVGQLPLGIEVPVVHVGFPVLAPELHRHAHAAAAPRGADAQLVRLDPVEPDGAVLAVPLQDAQGQVGDRFRRARGHGLVREHLLVTYSPHLHLPWCGFRPCAMDFRKTMFVPMERNAARV